MSTIEQIVAEYYARIDNCDFDWIMDLFSPNAVYKRADSTYNGKPAIDDFFRNQRKIKGVHSLETVTSTDNQVFAVGHFIGQGEKGDQKSIGFVDVWDFNSKDKVDLRRSYLALGHEAVLR